MVEERKVSDEKLLKLFDRFDNSKFPEILSKETFAKLKNNPNWDRTLSYKIQILKKMIGIVESKINATKALGDKYSISGKFIFVANNSMPNLTARISMTQSGQNEQLPVSDVSIPFNKLINMPAFEIYALISGIINAKILQKETGSNRRLRDVVIGEKSDDIKNRNIIEKVNEINESEKQRENAKAFLSNYLENYFKKIKMKGFDEYDDIAKLVAGQIVDEMDEKDLSKFMTNSFNIKDLEDEAIEKVSVFAVKDVDELRIDAEFNKLQTLLRDPTKKVEALTVAKQYEALVAGSLSDEFTKLIENQGDGQEIKVSRPLKEFCENFIETYMRSNNLKSIKFTFKNEGELGSYIDDGKEGRINVNLTKITTVTELISTLSHELTHAVESSKNKAEGNTTKEGFGLGDNIEFDISSSKLDRNSDEFRLLRELNEYCYRINPNERHGRYGELAGMKFMMGLSNREKLNGQLGETIRAFYEYQKETMKVVKELKDSDKIKDFEMRISKADLDGVPRSDLKLMEDRLSYIKKMMKDERTFNISMEEESMNEAHKYFNEIKFAEREM